MWIQTTLENRVEFYDAEVMDEPVEWSSNGTTTVTSEVGEALIEKYDHIEEHEANNESE